MASRLTVDVSEGMIVFTSVKSTVGCGDPGCAKVAVYRCSHLLGGRKENEICDHLFCTQHGMAVGGLMRCGPHARAEMKRRGM